MLGLADGPTEVHKVTVARQVLRERHGTNGLFPTQYIPALRDAAIAKYAEQIEQKVISAACRFGAAFGAKIVFCGRDVAYLKNKEGEVKRATICVGVPNTGTQGQDCCDHRRRERHRTCHRPLPRPRGCQVVLADIEANPSSKLWPGSKPTARKRSAS